MSPLRRNAVPVSAFLCALLVAGCEPQPTAPDTEMVPPRAEKPGGGPGGGSGGPTYSLVALPTLPGQSSSGGADLNDARQVLVVVLFPDNRSSAYLWIPGSSTAPEPLPTPAGRSEVLASDVNAAGAVAGSAGTLSRGGSWLDDGIPVIWEPSGSGWSPRALPVPGDGQGRAAGVNDLGEVVGFRFTDEALMVHDPLFWPADGPAVSLPVPDGFHAADGLRVNNQGDVAGMAYSRTPDGRSWQYGILWIRTGPSSWVPRIFQDSGVLSGVTDRRPDGTLLVAGTSDNGGTQVAARWTVTLDPASGVTGAAREVLGQDLMPGGAGHGISGAGDVAGVALKAGWMSDPVPALFLATGSTVALPMGRKRGTGAANAVSGDRWIAGSVDGLAVVWIPGR